MLFMMNVGVCVLSVVVVKEYWAKVSTALMEVGCVIVVVGCVDCCRCEHEHLKEGMSVRCW